MNHSLKQLPWRKNHRPFAGARAAGCPGRLKVVGVMFALVTSSLAMGFARADDPVFSGPQVGERLAEFQVKGAFGPWEGKTFDPVSEADGKPIVLFFVHQRTRPAFGLTRSLMEYAAKRREDGLRAAIVFLSEDPTETDQWLKRIQRYFPPGVPVGVSTDGQEGPGAYGLNRNVTVTALVGKDGKVTANFALVQPSLQADGVKIAEQVVKALGGGKVPTIEELQPRGGRRTMRKSQARPADDASSRSK